MKKLLLKALFIYLKPNKQTYAWNYIYGDPPKMDDGRLVLFNLSVRFLFLEAIGY